MCFHSLTILMAPYVTLLSLLIALPYWRGLNTAFQILGWNDAAQNGIRPHKGTLQIHVQVVLQDGVCVCVSSSADLLQKDRDLALFLATNCHWASP